MSIKVPKIQLWQVGDPVNVNYTGFNQNGKVRAKTREAKQLLVVFDNRIHGHRWIDLKDCNPITIKQQHHVHH